MQLRRTVGDLEEDERLIGRRYRVEELRLLHAQSRARRNTDRILQAAFEHTVGNVRVGQGISRQGAALGAMVRIRGSLYLRIVPIRRPRLLERLRRAEYLSLIADAAAGAAQPGVPSKIGLVAPRPSPATKHKRFDLYEDAAPLENRSVRDGGSGELAHGEEPSDKKWCRSQWNAYGKRQ